MTYEFTYEFMYMKNIMKSYLKSWVPTFHMSNLAAAANPWVPSDHGFGRIVKKGCYSHRNLGSHLSGTAQSPLNHGCRRQGGEAASCHRDCLSESPQDHSPGLSSIGSPARPKLPSRSALATRCRRHKFTQSRWDAYPTGWLSQPLGHCCSVAR